MNNGEIIETKSEEPITVSSAQRAYLRKIQKFPILSAEEEYQLAKRWQENKDQKALQKLVNSHLRLVAKIAHGYKGYGFPFSDLMSEGTVGIMQALDRFDPEKGFRLSTYATWWIHASIKEFVLKSWSLVKIGTTAAQKKLFFSLRRLKNELQKLEEREGRITEEIIAKISETLDVTKQEVRDMDSRMASQDYSLNTPISAEMEGEWIDWLEDDSENQEIKYVAREELSKKRELLDYALGYLNPREVQIFKSRFLSEDPPTLNVIAQDFNLSRERVRQIEIQAFKKVQKAMRQKAIEMRMMV